MVSTQNLCAFIDKTVALDRIIIQAHDFPDHDAISSAFGLAVLLKQKGASPLIVYNGTIDRISLSNMIAWLHIPVVHIHNTHLSPRDKIVTIDGCIGEKNVLDLPGDEIAVIDHHQVTPPNNLWLSDVRENYGATATIIFQYYQQLQMPMPASVATALLVGLNIDTANLTRGFCQADIESFTFFNTVADLQMVNKICRNEIELVELSLFSHIMEDIRINAGVAVVFIEMDCPKNMLGILGDFLLKVNEIDVVLVATESHGNIQLSFRSECPKVDSAQVACEVLNRNHWGFGGGHSHMAGGIILKDFAHLFICGKDYHFSPFVDRFIALRQ